MSRHILLYAFSGGMLNIPIYFFHLILLPWWAECSQWLSWKCNLDAEVLGIENSFMLLLCPSRSVSSIYESVTTNKQEQANLFAVVVGLGWLVWGHLVLILLNIFKIQECPRTDPGTKEDRWMSLLQHLFPQTGREPSKHFKAEVPALKILLLLQMRWPRGFNLSFLSVALRNLNATYFTEGTFKSLNQVPEMK